MLIHCPHPRQCGVVEGHRPGSADALACAGPKKSSTAVPSMSLVSRADDAELIDAPDLMVLTAPTRKVLAAIESVGGRPLMVGGCVRDAVLSPGSKPKDVDIEVHGIDDIDALSSALGSVGRVDEVGKSFAVLKITVGGEDFDVSLPRRDSKTGTGHRGFSVEAGSDVSEREATGRRDFTINALMWDPRTEQIIDHWGGVDDLEEGILRHTTEAFGEDPLRVMRGVQFSARFGFSIAEETAEVCRELSDSFAELPKERIWGEWNKMFSKGTHFTQAIQALKDTDWLRHFPELAATEDVPQDPFWHPEGNVLIHLGQAADTASQLANAEGYTGDQRTYLVAAAMLHDLGKVEHTQFVEQADGSIKIQSHDHAEGGVEPVKKFLEGIGAPKWMAEKICPIVKEHMCGTGNDGKPRIEAVRKLARRLDPATLEEWNLVCRADKLGRGEAGHEGVTPLWLEVAKEKGLEKPAPLILRGEHLMAEGMKPGPAFRPIMQDALAAQDAGEFEDEAGAIAWLHRRLQS